MFTVRAEDAATGGVLRKSWQVTVPAFASFSAENTRPNGTKPRPTTA